MAIENEFIPKLPMHPGRILLMEIEARQMTQKEFADRIGLTPKNLSDILNGKANITPDTALALGTALGSPPQLWMNLQSQYDGLLAGKRAELELETDIEMVCRYPYNELQKIHSNLPKTQKKHERVAALRTFFCVSSLKTLESHFGEFSIPCPYFRTTGIAASTSKQPDRYALACWIRKGQLDAAGICVPPYDERALRHAVPLIKTHSANQDVVGAWHAIEKLLLACGVKIVLVPYLPKTYVNGAMYWQGQNPVIILNAKSSYWDTMLFSLLHEIAHILKHGKRFRGISFETGAGSVANLQQEKEADTFAGDALLSQSELDEVILCYSQGETLQTLAQRFGVDSGIVAGRLAHQNKLSWNAAAPYRKQVKITGK